MKKKILSFMLAVCLFVPCLFMLTACGNSGVVGKYSLYAISSEGITWTKADFEAKVDSEDLSEIEQGLMVMASMLFEENAITLELKDDNTVVFAMSMMGQTEETTGTWTQDGDKITMTPNDEDADADDVLEITIVDGKLVVAEFMGEDGATLTFAKQ